MFGFLTVICIHTINGILFCAQDNGKTVRLICIIAAIYLCAAMGTQLNVGG